MNASEDHGCYPPPASAVESFVLTHVCLILGLIGIPLNVLTLVVLKMDKSKTTTRFLLIVLAVQDLLLIHFYLFYYVLNHYTDIFHLVYLSTIRHADSVILFFVQWVKIAESYTILLVSIDRFIAIRMPLKAVRICTVPRVARWLTVIIIVSCLVKLPNLIVNFQLAVPRENCSLPFLTNIPFFQYAPWYETFLTAYTRIFDQVTSFLIPLSLLTVLNVCLILHLQHNNVVRNTYLLEASVVRVHRNSDPMGVRVALDPQQRRIQATNRRNASQRSVTFSLIGVISVFVICELPAVFHFLFELYASSMKIGMSTLAFARYNYLSTIPLMITNCSVNFVIYVLTGRKFRRLCLRAVRLLCLKIRRRCCPCYREQDTAYGDNQMPLSVAKNTEAFALRSNCSGINTQQSPE